MTHQFKLGQSVRFVRRGVGDARLHRGDLWKVVRLLPFEITDEPTYRVRVDGFERAARESELEPGLDPIA